MHNLTHIKTVNKTEMCSILVEVARLAKGIDDYVVELIDMAHDVIANDNQESICAACNGSGEGMHEDGPPCAACNGAGECGA